MTQMAHGIPEEGRLGTGAVTRSLNEHLTHAKDLWFSCINKGQGNHTIRSLLLVAHWLQHGELEWSKIGARERPVRRLLQ